MQKHPEAGSSQDPSAHELFPNKSPSPQRPALSIRPTASRNDSIHPALRPDVTNTPVTPGIHLSTYRALPQGTLAPALNRNASGYFSSLNCLIEGMAESPACPSSAVLAGAPSVHDILPRMSLSSSGRRDSVASIDPLAANPELALSGSVISATFALPYSLSCRKGADWVLHGRRGTSALFDSFAHLSSPKTQWNHTLVAWTGEIKPTENELSPPDTPPATAPVTLPPLNKASAPIPVDASVRPSTPPDTDSTWISREDQKQLEGQLARDKSGKMVPVWLADDTEGSDGQLCLRDQGRWRRYAEQQLYTLFHYKQHEPTNGRDERKAWADYYKMNQKFANRILEVYKPGDIVVIHDYYLLLLPSMLRERVPHMYIGFFLHIPFPSSEFLRCLSRRKEILEGVLGANLVGFQSYSYSRHFVSCCTRILGFPSDEAGVNAYGSKVAVGVYPIGIDAAGIEKLAFGQPSIDEKVSALKKLYSGKKIVVGRDRLDSVRGVAQKLMAFERFLENYPEWRDRVVLMQVTSPTSVEEEKEDKIANKVSELVSRINGFYGSMTFSPVQHYPQYLCQEEYFALLRAADVGLITSVRDGMNTTSLEYVICQRDNHGPVILSEFSGTAGSLADAIHINPWDLSGVAHQLNYALSMSEEQRLRQHVRLYQHVTTHNVQAWSSAYLRRLVRVLGSQNKSITTPLLDRAVLLSQYRASEKRLFLFDYDGTLTPIVSEPAAAVPTPRILRTIQSLAADHRNAVWIISGRDQEFLMQHMGHISELGFSAEHGSFMRHPGSEEWINLIETFDMSWQSKVMKVFQKYTEKTPGSFIERKRAALTWHYRQAETELGVRNARECQKELEKTIAKEHDIEVMTGKANLEVRPTFVNKGEIAKKLVNAYGSEVGQPPAFVLCLGDDFTDEDMFRALNGSGLPSGHVFTVTVGASSKMTLAKWHILEPSDVISAIALLTREGSDISSADFGALKVVEGKIPELKE